MRALSWMTCLWPGLSALWLRGRLAGLIAAVAFTVLFNFALLATFSGAPRMAPAVAWVLVLGFWVAGIRSGRRVLSDPPSKIAPLETQLELLLQQAQTEYLKGHWIEAETLLVDLLAKNPDDVEGRLLLATVQRRAGQISAARTALAKLREQASSARWSLEIATELSHLNAREAPHKPTPAEEDTPPLARAA